MQLQELIWLQQNGTALRADGFEVRQTARRGYAMKMITYFAAVAF